MLAISAKTLKYARRRKTAYRYWAYRTVYLRLKGFEHDLGKWATGETRAALQIQDRSSKSRSVASLNQSQTQLTRPVATGLGMQRAPENFYENVSV